MAIGLQFHPESVLSPAGPHILSRCVTALLNARATLQSTQSPHLPKGTSVSGHDQASARLREFLTNDNPTVEEATAVFEPLTEGVYSDVETAALLVAIRTRGESAADLAGAARAFIDKAKPFPKDGTGLVDSCGTGGDGAHTINVSTAAALVAAAAGVAMVKHGNRSVSSKSGSADVLEALGIPLDLAPDAAARQLEDANFTFLFAPAYHPAIAHVMPVRKALKVPTVFNVLGPLLNPARPTIQLMGVANKDICGTVIEVMETLGRERAMVVHGDGIDEIAVHGPTSVWELNDGRITTYEITPEQLGLSRHPLSDLSGGDGEHNARILREILAGQGAPAHRDAVAANAGALLYLNGDADTLKQGVAKAGSLIDSGTVLDFVDSHFPQAGE
ncbi:anthranilate phosphoribosyltransferase [Corynebacterium sp. CCM 8862]|uniref:Anthranilate phosphoribosyltransferase n=1 Tax=Corynebacterium mendelii TaxID=2765362 RepID=A0A939E0V2_9CORY|nr:anthranilate phosphoribosyltransferase [Corynebacterium mendelii]